MLTLYVKDHCRYSQKAIDGLNDLGLKYELKNIKDPVVAHELIELGGKRQVPFLVDEDPCATAGHLAPCMVDEDVELYDSDDIVTYLQKTYGKTAQKSVTENPKLHASGEAESCESCE